MNAQHTATNEVIDMARTLDGNTQVSIHRMQGRAATYYAVMYTHLGPIAKAEREAVLWAYANTEDKARASANKCFAKWSIM